MTARPCGTKKRMAASSHNVNALGPALAAVATQPMPMTATRLKSTKSRKVRARSSCGVVSLVTCANLGFGIHYRALEHAAHDRRAPVLRCDDDSLHSGCYPIRGARS